MKKELSAPSAALQAAPSVPVSLAGTLCRPFAALARFYSLLLEETVTPRRAAAMLHAQTACLAAVFPAALPLPLRLACFGWAALALLGCRTKRA